MNSKPRLSERFSVRFAASFVGNVVRSAVSVLSGILVARGLGAAHYGELAFLLATLAATMQLLDAGATSAFYTFLSRRRRSKTFFLVYFGWVFGVNFLGLGLLLAVILPASVVSRLWVGQDRLTVLMAFLATFLANQLWSAVSQAGEAVRRTVVVQAANICQALAHLAIVLTLVVMHSLTLHKVLLLLFIEYMVLVAVVGVPLLKKNVEKEVPEGGASGTVVQDFLRFCRPMLAYGVVAASVQFADRWLLQNFGGAVQQGFFAIAQQFSLVALIATTSVLNVFWKELADADERKDLEAVKRLYFSVQRALYFSGAWLACLIIPYVPEILHITAGGDYHGASIAVGLMFLYPIHQSVGQIQGVVLLSRGDTGTFSRVQSASMLVALPVAYLLLAPRSAAVPGLDLGAVGLALKFVVMQFATVTIQGHIIARSHGSKYDLKYQIAVLGLLLGAGFAARFAVHQLFAWVLPGFGVVPQMITAIALYVVVTAHLVFRMPGLASAAQTIGFLQRRFAVWTAGLR